MRRNQFNEWDLNPTAHALVIPRSNPVRTTRIQRPMDRLPPTNAVAAVALTMAVTPLEGLDAVL
jgi:hypothetical protein